MPVLEALCCGVGDSLGGLGFRKGVGFRCRVEGVGFRCRVEGVVCRIWGDLEDANGSLHEDVGDSG